MRLIEVTPEWVVRNSRNRALYRFDRVEDRGRARIRPLELFPTGLLIPKPTPTTVSGDLEVSLIGPWVTDMVVSGTPTRTRDQYEVELAAELERLLELQRAYDELPAGGTGKQSRGSWANKIKNCESRIAVLRRGLDHEPQPEELAAVVPEADVQVDGYRRMQLVQLPSGRPAKVVSLTPSRLVRVFTVVDGERREAVLPPAMLRDWSQARLCSA